MTMSKKFIVILVLFVMAAIVGVYDSFIRKLQTRYFVPETAAVCYYHTVNI